MNFINLRYTLLIVFTAAVLPAHNQDLTSSDSLRSAIVDSLKKSGIIYNSQKQKPVIKLSAADAIKFLQERTMPEYWKDLDDPLRLSLRQLVFKASNPPYDSTESFIKQYPFDSLEISWDKFYRWDSVKMKIPVIFPPVSPLPVDTVLYSDSLKTGLRVDATKIIRAGLPSDTTSITDLRLPSDTSGIKGIVLRTDSTGILKVILPSDTTGYTDIRLPEPVSSRKPLAGLKDTVILVVADTLKQVTSDYEGFPFTYYSAPYQSDSIRTAVNTLINYIQARDSSIIYFTGLGDVVTPVWLNSRSGMMHRYWLKTDLDDSVTVWIGSQDRNTIGLYLENGITFDRPVRQKNYADARIELEEIDKSKLLKVKKIITKPQLWKYHSEASFSLNQASLNNWVKGGESNISTSFDITGYADYTNKVYKVNSSHFVRLKYGLISSGDKGIRKNLDLFETNNKVNHKAFGKFDFSGILLFKTQIAKGYNYPNDSVAVSKFMNPGILTLGVGLDYKPDKNTSINVSPVSYKGTYVPDTANIDQTKYGIAADRRSKNEFGASFMISNVYRPNSSVAVTNRLQLFTNYLKKPQNIDIDWEMIVTAKLNWFTDVRLNTHLIFDDDTKTPTYDKDNNPVTGSDGQVKKTARIQFKELLGFSFIFRF